MGPLLTKYKHKLQSRQYFDIIHNYILKNVKPTYIIAIL